MNNLNCWVSLHSTQPTYFIGGEGAYQDLLNIFERIGIELRPEIDNYFKKYNWVTGMINTEKIIYSINIEDIQTVAE